MDNGKRAVALGGRRWMALLAAGWMVGCQASHEIEGPGVPPPPPDARALRDASAPPPGPERDGGLPSPDRDAGTPPPERDAGVMPGEHDAGSDAGTLDPCDIDADGYRALSCGGDDCDDRRVEQGPPRLEGCDGLDNDCDFFVDEGACPCEGEGATRPCDLPGACAAGEEQCDGTYWWCSVGGVEETCDETDEDCDGAVDEGACG